MNVSLQRGKVLRGTMILFLAISGQAATAQSNPPSTAASAKLAVESSNSVGLKMLQQLEKSKTGKDNVIISPISINAVLAMILNGADGSTLTESATMLGVAPNQVDDLNQSMKALFEELVQADPEVELELSNAIFVQKGYPIRKEYLLALKNYLQAKSTPLDFKNDSAGSLTKINDWVRLSTNGRIPAILSALDPSTVAFLLNATYFKANWTSPFAIADTSVRKFQLSDGTGKDVQTMKRGVERFKYLETSDFQSVRLPYGNDRFGMYVMLPKNGKTASSLVPQLSESMFQKHIAALAWSDGTLFMPKFKLDLSYELKDSLSVLGMSEAFDGQKANLTKVEAPPAKGQVTIAGKLVVSEVTHKVFIEVNEKGTEAAAATGGGFSTTSVEEKPIPFVMDVNKPFLIVIRDNQTGLNLFVGVVNNPTS